MRKVRVPFSVRETSLTIIKLIEQFQGKKGLVLTLKAFFFRRILRIWKKSKNSKFRYSILPLNHFQLKKKITWGVWRIKKTWFDSKKELKEGKKSGESEKICIRNWKNAIQNDKWTIQSLDSGFVGLFLFSELSRMRLQVNNLKKVLLFSTFYQTFGRLFYTGLSFMNKINIWISSVEVWNWLWLSESKLPKPGYSISSKPQK